MKQQFSKFYLIWLSLGFHYHTILANSCSASCRYESAHFIRKIQITTEGQLLTPTGPAI